MLSDGVTTRLTYCVDVRCTALRAAAFVLSVAVAGLALEKLDFSPLGSAVLATLTLAGICRITGVQLPFADDRPLRETWRPLMIEIAFVIGLWLVASSQPGVRSFVCDLRVPHGLAIAIVGAFALAWLSQAAMIRSPSPEMSFFILLAFFWIAPFYGFFYRPWALAQGVFLRCSQGSIWMEILRGAGMIAGAIVGRTGARWMFKGNR